MSATTVLFVDDEALSRKYFVRAFGDEFHIRIAGSGAEALAILAEPRSAVAVLLSDQRMPAQNGVELLEASRRLHPQVVRLLITAYASLDDALAAVNRGEVYRYLAKPWDETTLRAELRGALSLFLNQRHERELLAARRQTLAALAASVAHEMRTPLASIQAAAGGIDKYLPALLQAHALAVEAGLDVVPIRGAHRQALAEALGRIQHTVLQAQTVIDLLLVNAKTHPSGGLDTFSMAACVSRALTAYPLSDAQRAAVRTELDADFSFRGSDSLMIYVLYNLLRNALYALEAAGKGSIQIRLQPGQDANRLLFRDTGSGMPAATRKRIFEDFFSGTSGNAGTGMGLGFCRRVMESIGGRIDCDSEHGLYTEFSLWLPNEELR